MNAVAKIEQKAALVAGGEVAAIIPRTIEETFRLAGAFHASGLAPSTLDTSEKVMVAIIAGAELGLAPYQAMQSFAVINRRPVLWGDAIPALLWANGFKIEEWYDDEDAATKAFCKVTRPTGEVIQRDFSLDDAKKAGLLAKQGPWQTAQKRMLLMRARGFCARDGAADALRGFQIREEVEDYQPIKEEPTGSGLRARLEAQGAVGPEGFAAEEAEPAEQDAEFSPAADLDATLDGDRIPELKTGAQLLAEKMEGAEPLAADADDAEHPPLGADLDGQVDAASPPAISPALLDQAASFKRGLTQLETEAELIAAVNHAKTDRWFLDLKAADLAEAKAVTAAADERLAEIRAAANG